MQAVILKSRKELAFEEVSDPKLENSNQLLVDIKATGICGTDLELYQHGGVEYPRILGHEIAGEVSQVGDNIETYQVGDKVVIHPLSYCQECLLCHAGKQNLCPNGGLKGREEDGGFAEYIAVDKMNVFKIPEGISYAEGTQIQTLTTVIHSQNRICINPGESVLVIGLGITGFMHAQLAKSSGAHPIIVTTRSQWKLDLAKELGIQNTISATDEDLKKGIEEITAGRGVDLVIDTVGKASTFQDALDVVSPGGTILQFAITNEALESLNFYQLYFKEVDIIGTRAATLVDWEPAISLVKNGDVVLNPLVTHQIPFQKVIRGFKMMEEKKEPMIRIVVTQ